MKKLLILFSIQVIVISLCIVSSCSKPLDVDKPPQGLAYAYEISEKYTQEGVYLRTDTPWHGYVTLQRDLDTMKAIKPIWYPCINGLMEFRYYIIKYNSYVSNNNIRFKPHIQLYMHKYIRSNLEKGNRRNTSS